MLQAVRMPQRERTTRMRALRRRVRDNDVSRWSQSFLDTLRHANHHSGAR
jgi:trehalose 6-phosphate synthase